MSNERTNGPGTNISFNPDAPTFDGEIGSGTVPEQPASPSAQAQSFTPDMPTMDGDTKTFVPRTRRNAQKSQRPTYNPDAATDDGDDWGASVLPTAPEKRPEMARDAETTETPFAPMGSRAAYPAVSREPVVPSVPPAPPVPSTPFKPMGSNANARRTPDVNPVSQPRERNDTGPVQPSRPVQTTPRQPVSSYEPPPQRPAPVRQPTPPQPIEQTDTYRTDSRSRTLQDMVSVEERRYQAEIQQYEESMAEWKKRIWIPFALVFLIVVLCLLGGAFAGILGVVFILFVSLAVFAILTAMGKLKVFLKPRKPKKQLPEMGTPELTSVYSVKLRLKSTNLPKPVEVTIRKEEQLLGCDTALCLQPLPYKGISHRHCTIISKHQHGHTTYFIRDEGSKNGTRLNERKLDAGIEYPLQIGDLITLAGRYQFKVMSDAY